MTRRKANVEGNINHITIKDSNFILQDDNDATKQVMFQLSSLSSGRIRILALPDKDIMVAGLDDVAKQVIVPASYIVYIDGPMIKAVNGITGKIDYSGTDAYTVIQNAIDRLPSPSGGEIYIKNSGIEYTLTNSLKNNGKRLHIDSDYAMLNSANGKYAFEIDSIGGVSISNSRSMSTIENLVIHGEGIGNGIRLFDTLNTTVQNIYISHPVTGIALEHDTEFVEDCNIRNIKIYNPTNTGIAIGNTHPGEYKSYIHNNFENIKIDLFTTNSIGILFTDFNFAHSTIKDLHIFARGNDVTGMKIATPGYFNCVLSNVEFEALGIWTGLTGIDFTGAYMDIPVVILKFKFVYWGANTKINNPKNLSYYEIDGNLRKDKLSGAFAIDSIGIKTVTMAHGLNIIPAVQDCYLTVIEDTAVDDWAYNLLKVVSTNVTNVIAKINVMTASNTVGATAKLGLRVGNP